MVENSNYTEPKHVVKAFVELGLDRQSRILDILAGSGVVAELVRQWLLSLSFILLRNSTVYSLQFFYISYVHAATPTSTLSTPAKICSHCPTKNNFIRSSTFPCWEGSTKLPFKTVSYCITREIRLKIYFSFDCIIQRRTML
jgi:hypothetical protein